MSDAKTQPDIGTAAKTQPAAKSVEEMNLWQKLAAITGEIGSIAKGGTNREQGYAFIEYGEVGAKLRELYAKYHIDFLPTMGDRVEREIVTQRGAKGVNVVIKFHFKFTNADKPDEIQEADWEGEASDYGDKATNKASTAAAKYFQMRKFNITEKGEAEADHETIDRGAAKSDSAVQKPTAKDAIKRASGVLSYKGFTDAEERKSVLLRIAGVTEVKDLTLNKLDHVMSVLAATTGDELREYLKAGGTAEEEGAA